MPDTRHAPERFTFSAGVTLRAEAGKGRPTLEILAYNGGPIRPDRPRLEAPLVIDTATMQIPAKIPVLLDHDTTQIIGQSTGANIAGGKVIIRGIVTGDVDSADTPAAQVVTHARNGFEWQASLGGFPDVLDYVAAGSTASVNGRTFEGPLYILRRLRVDEISITAIGADRSTAAKIAARSRKESPMFHEWIIEKGFDPANLTDAQRSNLKALYQAELRANGRSDASVGVIEGEPLEAAASRASGQIAAAALRLSRQNPDAADLIETAAREAVERGDDPNFFELRMVRELRPRIDNRLTARPGGAMVTTEEGRKATLAAAFLIRMGRATLAEKSYGAAACERANDLRARHTMDLFAASFRLAGRPVPRDDAEIIRLSAAGGLSNIDVPNLLADVQGKIALEQFKLAPAVWRDIAKVVPLQNFHAAKPLRVNWGLGFEEVAAGGELKHGTAGESKYEIQAATQGKILILSRTDIINDDLGMLSQMPEGFGRAASAAISDKVAKAILGNAGSFFSTGNSNLLTGAASVFGVASVANLITLMRTQTDSQKNVIDLSPAVLLVPPELEPDARRLLRTTTVHRIATTDDLPTGSPIPDGLKLAVEPRLSNVNYTGYSNTRFYIFSDTMNGGLLIGFVGGVEGPVIEAVDAGPNVLGLGFRGYIDFGVALGEPKAACRSNAA